MKPKASSVGFVLAAMCLVSPAFAEERPTWSAEVSLAGVLTGVRGNEAKFNEYRDLQNGAYGSGRFLYDTDRWFLTGEGKDFGYDTQRYRLDGGMWGLFRADAYYQEIPHNITFDARSMFNDVGTPRLQLSPTVNPNDFTTWPSTFDYTTKRRQAGGDISLDAFKPFFVTLSGQTEVRRGIKPAGVSLESNDLFALELPERIDYQTDTVKGDIGYAGKQLHASLYAMYMRFHNANETQGFPNVFDQTTGAIIVPGAATTRDDLTLPPSNQYYKVGFKGSVALPLRSRLSLNTAWSRTTSSARLLTDNVLDAVAPAPVLPMALSQLVFDGQVETENVDLVLTTSPVAFLDGKFFYKYYNRDNKSDRVTQTDDMGDTFVNRLFGFQKNEVGAEAGFWLPARLRLTTGFAHVDTERRHQDVEQHNALTGNTVDDIASAELTWKGLEFMTARAGYEHVIRNTNYRRTGGTDGAPVPGARNVDVAPFDRDRVKLRVDLDPVDWVSLGVGFRHTETDYNELRFGLKHDRREEVFSDADVKLTSYAQLFAGFDYQWVTRRQEQLDQSISNTAFWRADERETYWEIRGGTNITLIPRMLVLRVLYTYARSDGSVDVTVSDDTFTTPGAALAGIGANNNNIDIPRRDTYTKQTLGTELVYDVTKHVAVAVGYAYETFKYSDTQLDNYLLVVPTSGADHNGAFLTGAFARQSYDANIGFVRLTYKFQ